MCAAISLQQQHYNNVVEYLIIDTKDLYNCVARMHPVQIGLPLRRMITGKHTPSQPVDLMFEAWLFMLRKPVNIFRW